MSTFPSGPDATTPPPAGPPPKKGLSGCAIAGIGCAIAAVVGLIVVVALVGGGAWWALTAGPGAARDQHVTQIQQSSLPPAQKQELIDRIDQLTEDYEADRITIEQWSAEYQTFSEDLTEALMSGGREVDPASPAPAGPDATPAAP